MDLQSHKKQLSELKQLCNSNTEKQSPLWTPDEIAGIESFLKNLYAELTYQQFIYDTFEISELASLLQAMFLSKNGIDPQCSIVARKLISHQVYSNKSLWQISVRLMLTNYEIATEQCIKDEIIRWYRLFFLDHAVSRMYTAGLGYSSKSGLRSELISEFRHLTRPKSRGSRGLPDVSVILRVAHFEGHLGNDGLNSLQNVSGQLSEDVSDQVNAAEQHFQLATLYRLAMLPQLDAQAASPEVPLRPSWLTSPFKKLSGANNGCEAFANAAQAYADIANQLSCLVCVLCYKFVVADSNRREIVTEIVETSQAATFFWNQLRKQLLVNNESQIYRVIQRRRISEHMLWILKDCFPREFANANAEFAVFAGRYSTKVEGWEQKIFDRFSQLCSAEK